MLFIEELSYLLLGPGRPGAGHRARGRRGEDEEAGQQRPEHAGHWPPASAQLPLYQDQVLELSSRTWGQLKQLNNPESCKEMNERMHDPVPPPPHLVI